MKKYETFLWAYFKRIFLLFLIKSVKNQRRREVEKGGVVKGGCNPLPIVLYCRRLGTPKWNGPNALHLCNKRRAKERDRISAVEGNVWRSIHQPSNRGERDRENKLDKNKTEKDKEGN